MTLIYKDDSFEGPAIHAIIIGVGWYKHLLEGGGRLYDKHNNMSQLTMPPISASAIANWLIENCSKPDYVRNDPLTTNITEAEFDDYEIDRYLKSVELLVSDTNLRDNPYSHQMPMEYGDIIDVEGTTFQEIKHATERWRDRGDRRYGKHDLMLFYFCGHGMGDGAQITLLTSDFGHRDDEAFVHAIDYNSLPNNMSSPYRNPDYFCFFVDACRDGRDELSQFHLAPGKPLIEFSGKYATKKLVEYRSTLMGLSSWGRPGNQTYFTEALLMSLKGGASDYRTGDAYKVYTPNLQNTLDFLTQRFSNKKQGTECITASVFPILKLQNSPIVPVIVTCSTKDANKDATFVIEQNHHNGTSIHHVSCDALLEGETCDHLPFFRNYHDNSWITELESLDYSYSFNVEFNNGRYCCTDPHKGSQKIEPPLRVIKFSCERRYR